MVERSKHAVSNVLAREPRPAATAEWNPSSARLSLREREEIRGGLERGESCTVIARLIGRAARRTAAAATTRPGVRIAVPRRKPGGPSGRS
jgi:hypothetical protein